MHLLHCSRLLLTAVLAAFAPAMSSCAQEPEETSGERVQREARELSEALADYSAEQKEEALATVREALSDLDARIEALEAELQARWSEMDQTAREKARQKLEALERQRGTAAQWQERLEESSAEAWNSVRDGFTEAYATLRESWREAEAEIDSGN